MLGVYEVWRRGYAPTGFGTALCLAVLLLWGVAGTAQGQSPEPTRRAITPVPTPTTAARSPTPGARPTPTATARATSIPTPQLQQLDARGVMEASIKAMESARSLRFTGTIRFSATTGEASRPEMSLSLPVRLTGEFQSPDGVHLVMEAAMFGPPLEVVSIGGQSWGRQGQGPWEEFGELTQPTRPTGRPSDWALPRTLQNATLTDVGTSYRVSTDIDSAFLAEATGFLQADLPRFGVRGVPELTGTVTLTVDKKTLYLETLELQMDLAMPVPTTERTPAAAATSLTMQFSFSDFNSPAIEIQPPVRTIL